MKPVTVLVGIAVLFFAGPLLIAAEPESESANTSEAMMQNMHAHMQKMQQQMEYVHSANDPVERKALMHEHMQAMHEGMAMMADMEAAGMHEMMNMGGMQMQGKGSQGKADGMPCQQMVAMKARHNDMQQRTQMMRQMMEQIVEHQSAQEASSE